jgi:GNAT superfamily N-acetyltransferase
MAVIERGPICAPELPCVPDTGDYVPVGRYLFVLYPAAPGDLDHVIGLVREASKWLAGIGTDQWQNPWPNPAGQQERILNDLLKGKTWLVRDGETTIATITVDDDEPLDLNERPVWPRDEHPTAVVYVRRLVVRRSYASHELGAALLDWAADWAKKRRHAKLIRIDVWTTNTKLHNYYESQKFIRCQAPQGLGSYPSQALFERPVDVRGSSRTRLFIMQEGQDAQKLLRLGRRRP